MKGFALSLVLLTLAFDAGAEISFERLAQLTDGPQKQAGSFIQQKYLQAVDASLESSGVFEFERGKSIRWEIREPIHSELVMTPEGIHSGDGEQALLQIETSANPTVAALGELFFAILTSDWKVLQDRVELSGDIDGGSWHAVLEPKTQSTRLVFDRLELSGHRLLEKIVLHESSGDRTTIHLDAAH